MIEFDDGKLWFVKKGSTLTLGITAEALEEIGDVEKLRLPDEGEDFGGAEILGEVRGSDGVVKLFAPAAGRIVEVNPALEDFEALQEDPMNEGWIIKIEIEDEAELKDYL